MFCSCIRGGHRPPSEDAARSPRRLLDTAAGDGGSRNSRGDFRETVLAENSGKESLADWFEQKAVLNLVSGNVCISFLKFQRIFRFGYKAVADHVISFDSNLTIVVTHVQNFMSEVC